MAQVRVTARRARLDAAHAVRGIHVLRDVLRLDRAHEAGPSRAGLELVGRGEEWLPGHDVDVDPGLVMVPELVAERRLGGAALRHLVLCWGECPLQLGVRRLLVDHGVASSPVLGREWASPRRASSIPNETPAPPRPRSGAPPPRPIRRAGAAG